VDLESRFWLDKEGLWNEILDFKYRVEEKSGPVV